MINPAIFRAYDIRGSSLLDLSAQVIYRLSFCFARGNTTPSNHIIYLGRDGRLSSSAIYQALISGLVAGGNSNGVKVKLISTGIVPTPVLYFADHKFQPAASIMITGSHNPKDDNGLKIITNGRPFFGQQLQDLLTDINNTDWHSVPAMIDQSCHVEEIDLNQPYIAKITSGLTAGPVALKVAWDPGNGAAGDIVKSLTQLLLNDNIVINTSIDGNFPGRSPDPTIAANLLPLIDLVITNNCDFGVAFDGDADRIVVITGSGKIVFGDNLLYLFAQDILASHPGATVILDVKASQVVLEQIQRCGGQPVLWKTGHPWIKTKMIETKALIAGEMSGHLFFADQYYGYDDGIYAAIRLIELLTRLGSSLDQFFATLPKTYNTPEIIIKVAEQQKFSIIEQISRQLDQAQISYNNVDGIRVTTPDGWWLLRASNTSPAVIARYESRSRSGLRRLKSTLLSILARHNLSLD